MDIGRALTYFSEDDRWVEKTAIGTGLLLISTLFLVMLIGIPGYFVLWGYLVRLVQNVRDNADPVLPEWDQWGDDLVRGMKLACVYLVWALPLVPVSVSLVVIRAVILGTGTASYAHLENDASALYMLCSLCLSLLFGIAYVVLQPALAIAFARNEEIRDGLRVSEIWNWIRGNIDKVVIVGLLTMMASLILTTVGSIVGVLLCFIGTVVTLPLSQMIVYFFQSHLYGQLARIAENAAATDAFGAVPESPPMDRPSTEDGLPEAPAAPVPPVVFDPTVEPDPPPEPEPPAAPKGQ